MLGYIEIVLRYLKKNYFHYQGKERPAKKKLVLSTVSSVNQLPQIFRKIRMFLIDIPFLKV